MLRKGNVDAALLVTTVNKAIHKQNLAESRDLAAIMTPEGT